MLMFNHLKLYISNGASHTDQKMGLQWERGGQMSLSCQDCRYRFTNSVNTMDYTEEKQLQ